MIHSPSDGRSGSGVRRDLDGWIYVRVEGAPYDRGWHHGYLLASEIRNALSSIDALLWHDTALPFSWYAANARAMWLERMAGDNGGKLADGTGVATLDELRGIMDGANTRRIDNDRWISIDDLLAWNGYPEMICQWQPGVLSGILKPLVPVPGDPGRLEALVGRVRLGQQHYFHPHHCSAFVATGDWTADRGIVSAHTTWQRFANGDFYNVVLHIVPPDAEGFPILMQTAPGYVASSMDFGLNSAGLAVSSTSINVSGFDQGGLPYFLRARRAGQRAATIECWIDLFRQGNNGGYANTWLLAEAATNRIAAYELTTAHEEQQPILSSGFYCSCNIPFSTPTRVLEAGGAGYDNILQSGGRRVRFEQLMAQHKGAIDGALAQTILADHFDLYRNACTPSGRSICGHYDVDDGALPSGHTPFHPFGSLDGKVIAGAIVGAPAMEARWGRACGTPFDAGAFFARHPQYRWMQPWTRDRPARPWCTFPPELDQGKP